MNITDDLIFALIMQAAQDLKNAYSYLQNNAGVERQAEKRMKELSARILDLESQGYDHRKQRNAYRRWYHKYSKYRESLENIEECEEFFRGNLYKSICDIDGEKIIERLKKIAKENGKLVRTGEGV